MSNLRESERDPNDPLYYAPRHTRFALNAVPEPFHDEHIEPPKILQDDSRFRHNLASEPPPPIPLRQRSQVFEDAVSRALQESMEPQDIYTPSMLDRREGLGFVGRFAVALGIVALIAAFFVVVVPIISGPAGTTNAADSNSIWRQIRTALMPSPPRKATAATLQFADQEGEANDTLPLGVTVISPPPGSVVILSGLPAGTRLPAGKKVSANDWRIAPQDMAAAAVTPPADFVGQVQVNAELRNAEGAALVGGTFRMTWQGTANVAIAARPATSQIQAFAPAAIAPSTITVSPAALAPSTVLPQQPTPAAPQVRNIDPNEIANMIKRAQDLVAGGDIVPARLLLQRAAEARSARAALILASTYDPILLKQTSNGPLPDIGLARNWYAKALEWGAPEAQRQLEALRAY